MSKASVLITAGPTREKIDPVRFISNYSTGTFGYEIAKEARRRGWRVTLVSGPVCLKAPPGVRLIKVESAVEMARVVVRRMRAHDCLIMAAAVSDWRVRRPAASKIKRSDSGLTIELTENPDILREACRKKAGKVLVGFALETEDLEANAAKKLKAKGLDLVIANRLTDKANLFGDRRLDVVMIDRMGSKKALKGKTKRQLAKIILDKVSSFNI